MLNLDRLLIHVNNLMVFGRPVFESWPGQSLRASIFEDLWPGGSKTDFFERSDLYLLGKGKKNGFAAILRRSMVS